MGDFGNLLENKKTKHNILMQFGNDETTFLNGLIDYMYKIVDKRKLNDMNIIDTFCSYINYFLDTVDIEKLIKLSKRCNELQGSLNKEQQRIYLSFATKINDLLIEQNFDYKRKHLEQINLGKTIDEIINNNDLIIFDLLNKSEIAKFKYHDGQQLVDKVYNKFIELLQEKNLKNETLEYLKNVIFAILSTNKHSKKIDEIINKLDKEKHNLNSYEQNVMIRNLKDTLYILKDGKIPEKNLEQTVKILRRQYNIHTNFKEEALIEAQNLKTIRTDIKDYRDKQIITIDSSFKSAYDDAISLEKTDYGYLLGIYITDVSSFIDIKSSLGIHARQRCESIYLTESNKETITMFPENISKQFFSLNSKEDKQVVAYMFKFSNNYDFMGCEYTNALINVNHNYTYDSIDKIALNDQNYDMIYSLIKITDSLKKEYNLNYHKMKEKIKKTKSNTGSDIVSSSMIFLNSYIAKLFKKRGYPLIYRVNESVTDENILNSSLDKLVKGYSKSYYSSIPGNHVITNSEYCHITNPIRNYPSFINQHIFEFLFLDWNEYDKVKEFINYWQNELPILVDQINNKINQNDNYVKIMKTLKK